MLQTAQRSSKRSTSKKAPPHERFLEAFRWMLLARTLEDKLASLYRGGLITGGVYVGRGQEAVSVACGLFLQKGDIFAPLDSRSGRALGIRRTAGRCGAHVSRFATGPNARTRRQHSSRPSARRPVRHDQSSWRDDLGHSRSAHGQAMEGREGFCRPNHHRRRRNANRRDARRD